MSPKVIALQWQLSRDMTRLAEWPNPGPGDRDMAIPPLDFLLEASLDSLRDLELASLNLSANLAKGLRREIDLYVEQVAVAMVARWMIENRQRLLAPALTPKQVELFKPHEQKKLA